jgi:hypothetical protein
MEIHLSNPKDYEGVFKTVCTTENLLKAITILQEMNAGKEVTAIQYEDGSGRRFNYQINSGKWQYIDLTGKINLTVKK